MTIKRTIIGTVGKLLLCALAAFAMASCSTKKSAQKVTVSKQTSGRQHSSSSKKSSQQTHSGKQLRPAEVTLTTSKDITALLGEARKWLGTPYNYGGHTRGKGTDCSGMIMELFLKIFDLKLPRSSAMQHEYSRRIDHSDLRPGDLVFFATGSRKDRVSHVGLYVGNGRMIHASSSRGVIESNLDDKYWRRTSHSAGRIVETDPSRLRNSSATPEPEITIDALRLQELYDALDQTIDSIYVSDPEIFD